jgi:hypothetical protein
MTEKIREMIDQAGEMTEKTREMIPQTGEVVKKNREIDILAWHLFYILNFPVRSDIFPVRSGC